MIDQIINRFKNSLSLEASKVPLKVMNSQEVFERELERVFSRSWVFLGFTDEVPSVGDFVVRNVGLDSFIIIRGDDGRVRGFFNACRHMGTQLCEVERGSARIFTCPYHGWSYNNLGKLIGVPVKEIAYKNLDLDKISLAEIRVETYENLIFGNMYENAISLKEYLGEMIWYLDIIFKASGGMKPVGSPFRFIGDFDWKIGAANFAENRIHTIISHKSVVELGYASPVSRFGYVSPGINEISVADLKDSKGRPVASLGMRGPPDDRIPGYFGFYGKWYEEFKKPDEVSDIQFNLFKKFSHTVFTIFPNFSMFIAADQTDKSGKPNAPVSLVRLWNPLGPGITEVWTWVVAPKVVPDEIAKRVYEVTTAHFGSSGVAEMDDMAIWRRISKASKGIYSNEIDQLLIAGYKGISDLPVVSDWPGPGIVRPIQFHEECIRTFWKRYLIEMLGEGNE
jgi:3-phenylpropionate/trans-cinnamate dioxygenase alpha subunit